MAPAALLLFALLSTDSHVLEVRDQAGAPIAEGAVELSSEEGDLWVAEVEGGRALLERDGTWNVLAVAEGFLPWRGVLRVPSAEGPMEIRLRRAARLQGRVRDETGAAVSGAVIRVVRDGDAIRTLHSSEGGAFATARLEPGLVALEVSADGHVPSPRRDILLRSGGTQVVALELRRSSSLGLSVRGPEDEPLRGVEARIVTAGEDGLRIPEAERERLGEIEIRTDGEGHAVFEDLPRGLPLRFSLRRDGYAPGSVSLAPRSAEEARTARLREGGAIRVRLLDEAEEVVEGATVELSSSDAVDLDLVDDPEPSDAEGVFLAEDLPAGNYTLRIHAPGRRPVTLRGVALAERETEDVGEVVLPPGLELAGRVLSTGDDPLPEASVEAVFHEEGRELETETASDEEGRFRLTGLPEGPVRLTARAEGYLDEEIPRALPGEEDLVLRLRPTGGVEGTVLDERTGQPVAVFQVVAMALEGGGSSAQEDVWDAAGRFRVDGLTEGRWRLRVTADGWRPGDSEAFEVVSGEVADAGTVFLDPGLELEGLVLDARDDRPVEGAEVRAGTWQVASTASTDEEGRFRVDGLDGRPMVRVDHPAFQQVVLEEVDLEEEPFVTVRLEKGGALEGTVRDGKGDPLPGAQVRAFNIGVGGGKAVTDAEGHYRIEGLAPGTMAVTKVDVPGTSIGEQVVRVQIRDGETTRRDFPAGARLAGTVSAAGSPASGAKLFLTESEMKVGMSSLSLRQRTAVADEEGAWSMPGLEPGGYMLGVRWEGRQFSRELEMGSRDLHVDIEFPDLVLAGRVVEESTGEGIHSVRLLARKEGNGGMTMINDQGEVRSTMAVATDVTDTSGGFRLQLDGPGTWSVQASREGFAMLGKESATFEVDSSRHDAVIPMRGSARLRVRLVDAETGRPIPGGQVTVVKGNGKSSYGLGVSGTEVLEDVSPGTVSLYGAAKGYAQRWEEIDLEAGEDRAVDIELDRGGALRLLLPPPRIEPSWMALWRAGFRLETLEGKSIDNADPLEGEDGALLLRHVPDGPLVVGLGEREERVIVPLGGEVAVDLR